MRFLDAQRHALEELMKYYKAIDHKRITRPTEISKAMAESAKIMDSLDRIEQRVKQEMNSKIKTRADREVSLYEDPD